MNNILEEIVDERIKQTVFFGEQNHSPLLWNAILGEEVGEVACEVLEGAIASGDMLQNSRFKNLRAELIQVAAVAVAFVESLDRNELA